MNLKLDAKTLIIAGLLVSLVLSWVLRPSKPVDKYEAEISALKSDNAALFKNNGLLVIKYDSITKIITSLEKEVKKNEAKLDSTNKVISKLKKKRVAIPAHVDTLKTTEIITEYDNYLKRRDNK